MIQNDPRLFLTTRVAKCTHMEACKHKEGKHIQHKALEILDNLDKNPAAGMGKKVSTVHTLYIFVLSSHP